MVRQVQITLPANKYDLAYGILNSREFVHRLQGWHISNEQSIIIFKIVEKKVWKAVEILNRYGIGVDERNGTIDIFSLSSTKPRIVSEAKKKKEYKMSDRLTYEEIYEIVDSQLHLTFDYLALNSVGAMIAGVGLLANSSVAVVASMLVSPLMGPIVGMTFSAIIWDRKMWRKSFRNELYGVLVCWVWGALVGVVVSPFIDESVDMAMVPGSQMTSRGTAQGVLEGLFIAIPSGCGVALGVAGDQINPLVGVAISASLLPPVVNSGLAIALGIMVWLNEDFGERVYEAHYIVGMYSMILFLVNWAMIIVFGYFTFKIKRLTAHKQEDKRAQLLNRFAHTVKGRSHLQVSLSSRQLMKGHDDPNLDKPLQSKSDVLNGSRLNFRSSSDVVLEIETAGAKQEKSYAPEIKNDYGTVTVDSHKTPHIMCAGKNRPRARSADVKIPIAMRKLNLAYMVRKKNSMASTDSLNINPKKNLKLIS